MAVRIWKQSEHHTFHENLIFGKTRPLDKPQRVVGNGKPNPEVGDIMIMSHWGDVLSFVVTEFVEEFTKDSGFMDCGLDGYWAVNVAFVTDVEVGEVKEDFPIPDSVLSFWEKFKEKFLNTRISPSNWTK